MKRVALLVALVLAVSGVASAASVPPELIPGASNDGKTCAEVYGAGIQELRVPGTTGTYSLGGLIVAIVAPSTEAGSSNSFDWTSNKPVEGVIVKDGVDGANWYDYQPDGSTGDTYLTTPFNGDKGISHINFCFYPRLTVSKTAATTFTRTWQWDIDKSASPATWDLFKGDSGTSQWAVSVDKTGYIDSAWSVSGSITIENDTPYAATITGVTDVVSPSIAAGVDCGVTFPYSLAAGGTLVCSYGPVGLPDGASRTNTATVTTSGMVLGGPAAAPVVFGAPTTVVNASVNVTDTNGESWGPVSDDATWTYSETFYCDADEGTHDNTATITETGQYDDASVTVNCYDLAVTKDAAAAYTRTWHWTIDKSVTPDEWNLFRGDSGTSRYTVSVDKTGYTDSDWAVDGDIAVYNPAPMAATINSVADVVSPAIVASVDCGVTFPYSLAAGGTLGCSYESDLADASSRTNTATATLQNYDYDKDLNATPDGTTDFSGTANVIFGAPTLEVDASVNVTDTNGESWGPISDDAVFNYTRTFACDADEGTHDNTATITETGQYDDASVLVNCYELEVTKDAHTSLTRTWEWDIDKSVTPEVWDLFRGDSGTSLYTVLVDKVGSTDSAWAVEGFIWVDNPAPLNALINGVGDLVSPDIAPFVFCPVSFPYTLGPSETLLCAYGTPLPDASTRTNTATATLQNYDYSYTGAGTPDGTTGFSGQAAVDFVGATITEVYDEIHVTDTYAGSLGSATDDTSFTYHRTFSCDADEGTHDNTATITETQQSDDASVLVNCYDLEVTKDAATSFTRTWTWTIDKSADHDYLLNPVILSPGQVHEVYYEVTVDAVSADSAWAVEGGIAVHNPAPIPAVINSVADVVSPAIAASVDCGVSFPYTLAAGGTLNCTYYTALPSASSRTNTATATLQNYAYDHEAAPVMSGTSDFSGQAAVDFSTATMTEVDECIDVTDTDMGFLGTVCATDTLPYTFYYSLTYGEGGEVPWGECGFNEHLNTAAFVANDTGATDEADWLVTGSLACEYGCSLTPGYWKTHSLFGPAPYDDTWALLTPSGENSPFFLSGKTYYQVLWINPSGGNAYYILAHAYIAARLNQLNGASFGAAQAVFDQATALFNLYNPSTVVGLKGKGGTSLRATFIYLAGVLDAYNNGLIGPGHCTE